MPIRITAVHRTCLSHYIDVCRASGELEFFIQVLLLIYRTIHDGNFDLASGDKTAIELFLAGVRCWEVRVQRRLDVRKPKQE